MTAEHELVDVIACGLHPRVRSAAAGAHYTSTGALPMVPGVDGVARRADGSRVYFVADDELTGPMAERTVIDVRRSVALPDSADAYLVAAAMNPAMSSWVALRRRVPLLPGQSVLVLGATGNAGSMAIQVAKLLGAGAVIGAGRDQSRLEATRADERIRLTGDLDATAAAFAEKAAEVDIVIDYLWGPPAEHAMTAVLTGRADRSRPIDWIQIGAVAGPTMNLPSALLRQANIRIQGVGQGAVSLPKYLAELPALIERVSAGDLSLTPRPVPLREVKTVWSEPDHPGERIVLIP